MLFVLIYVDYIIVTGSNSLLISDFIYAFGTLFPVKHLDHLHYFLGIEIFKNNEGLFLSQSKYVYDLLHRTKMHNAKSIFTHMSVSTNLTALDGSTFEDPHLYRSVVSSL